MRGKSTSRSKAGAGFLAVSAAGALLAALGLNGCQSTAGFTPTSLVRVIDASYIAPAANVYVDGELFAGNIGQGFISLYNTVTPSVATVVKVTPAKGNTPSVTSSATLKAGTQHTVFITDNGAADTQYVVTVLEDQSTAAPAGKSSFRFLNQAPGTGAVDVYMVPSGSELDDAKPLVSGLDVGASTSYISFSSQAVTMVITPAGTKTSKSAYSASLALAGGEVRTVVVVDSQLTSNPPVQALVADDLN